MKKAIVLLLIMMVAYSPMSFALCSICQKAQSDKYAEAAVGKLGRGLANTALGWVELFRQPYINENHWEGFGKGLVYTVGRTGSGILEVVTFPFPKLEIPLPDPSCPLEMRGSSKAST